MTIAPPSGDPAAASADAHYFQRLSEGVFEIPQCRDCGRHHFFPRVVCPHCGSVALQWAAPSGLGTVYSTTVVRKKEGDYNVCLVDLDEGPRMMSRVIGVDPGAVRIGHRVRAQVLRTGEDALLVFAPAGERQ
ncbi:MAG: OB-fold domain-containing protein [Pseudomonadota bacterium]